MCKRICIKHFAKPEQQFRFFCGKTSKKILNEWVIHMFPVKREYLFLEKSKFTSYPQGNSWLIFIWISSGSKGYLIGYKSEVTCRKP